MPSAGALQNQERSAESRLARLEPLPGRTHPGTERAGMHVRIMMGMLIRVSDRFGRENTGRKQDTGCQDRSHNGISKLLHKHVQLPALHWHATNAGLSCQPVTLASKDLTLQDTPNRPDAGAWFEARVRPARPHPHTQDDRPRPLQLSMNTRSLSSLWIDPIISQHEQAGIRL